MSFAKLFSSSVFRPETHTLVGNNRLFQSGFRKVKLELQDIDNKGVKVAFYINKKEDLQSALVRISQEDSRFSAFEKDSSQGKYIDRIKFGDFCMENAQIYIKKSGEFGLPYADTNEGAYFCGFNEIYFANLRRNSIRIKDDTQYANTAMPDRIKTPAGSCPVTACKNLGLKLPRLRTATSEQLSAYSSAAIVSPYSSDPIRAELAAYSFENMPPVPILSQFMFNPSAAFRADDYCVDSGQYSLKRQKLMRNMLVASANARISSMLQHIVFSQNRNPILGNNPMILQSDSAMEKTTAITSDQTIISKKKNSGSGGSSEHLTVSSCQSRVSLDKTQNHKRKTVRSSFEPPTYGSIQSSVSRFQSPVRKGPKTGNRKLETLRVRHSSQAELRAHKLTISRLQPRVFDLGKTRRKANSSSASNVLPQNRKPALRANQNIIPIVSERNKKHAKNHESAKYEPVAAKLSNRKKLPVSVHILEAKKRLRKRQADSKSVMELVFRRNGKKKSQVLDISAIRQKSAYESIPEDIIKAA